MTIMPFLVFVGAICLAYLYERLFASLGVRWVASHDKQEWSIMYWAMILVLLCCSKILAATPANVAMCFPGICVAFIHVFTDFDLDDFKNWRSHQGSNQSSTTNQTRSSLENRKKDSHNVENQRLNENEKE